jgi:hypothetical protein
MNTRKRHPNPYTAPLVNRPRQDSPARPTSHKLRRRLPAAALAILVAVVATALSAGIGAAGAGAKPAAKKSAFTIKKSVWGGPTAFNGQSLFPTFKDLGFGIFNMQARWDQIAPTIRPLDATNPNDPAYQWPQYLTEAVEEADANGMQIQILVMGTPGWANGGRSWQWVPNDVQDYGDFAQAISRKYPQVDLWMAWGEPNRETNLAPFTKAKPKGKLNKKQQRAPRNYARMLDSFYGGIKGVDAADKVIGGNTFTASGKAKGPIRTYQWVKYLKLPGGKRPRMDMWGHNPWGFSKPNLKSKPSPQGTVAFNDLGRLLKALDKSFGKKRKLKLYLAEWGIPTGFKDQDLGYKLSTKTAKSWLKAAFKIAKNKRIYTVGWVHLLDKDRNSTGLLDKNGNRKPLYNAFKAIG